jgi:acetylglutamate kinase
MVVAAADTNKPGDFTVFAEELANRLRVFKLILLDRQGGLIGANGERTAFMELNRIAGAVRKERTARRRAELRAVARALRGGVG